MERKNPKKLSNLTDEDIVDFLENIGDDKNNISDESEVDSDGDEFDDPNYVCPADEIEISRLLNSTEVLTNAINLSINISNLEELEPSLPTASAEPVLPPRTRKSKKRQRETEFEEEADGPSCSTSGIFSGISSEIKVDAKEFKSILWRKKPFQLHVNDIVFHGEKRLPEMFDALKTPYDCLAYFITEDFLKNLANQMNLYARQQDISSKFTTNAIELRKFIGILYLMSVYRYPNVRSYWGRHSLAPVREAMSRNRFEEIRSKLHFNDNTKLSKKGEIGYDALYKIRPIITHFNERFLTIPMVQRLCVDEQMCPTKMQGNPTRQYMPAKPHKWGTKLFALCDSFGYCYSFEIYSGAGDNIIFDNCPDLGASSNVVVRLAKNIPDNINHIVYFDNFYTSLGLVVYLKSRGIHSLGTVRPNRVPNIKLSTDAVLDANKVARGYSEEYVGTAFGVDLANVLWRDTKTVRLVSSYVGIGNFLSSNIQNSISTVSRWDKKKKQNIEISCPNIIKEYNTHMGGVDLLDGLIGRYKISMKTRKWTNRIFFHMLDVAMVNAYVLYHRLPHIQNKCQLPDFRTEVAETLCLLSQPETAKRGRPKSCTPPVTSKRTYMPNDEIRYDQIGHWCTVLERTGKKMCKMAGCKSETQCFCEKCKVNLCNSVTNKCFFKFHNP